MKKLSILSFLCFLICINGLAQITPQPSPAASVAQTVGTTRISIDYSRPTVKGREIFGKLVAFGKVWRTGANAATKFETSTDITVEGQKLAAGKYSILSIPEQNEWTIIFSKNLSVSEQSYKDTDDVLRVKVASAANAMAESLTYDFTDIKTNTANLNIYWDKTKVSLNIGVDVDSNVDAAINKQTNETAMALQAGADFLMNNGSLDKALGLVDKSIALKENFRNTWTKSQILDKLGKPAEALSLAEKAKSLGGTDPIFQFFKDGIDKGINDIKSKIPAVPAAVQEVIKGKKKN